ncbi:hypothetical protein SBA7_1750010 [Candidatus Sulfotelmatobacter sp. SbA7]|nr:hypothetical protein SBA7_1750010 [Candidatus Sulfotelmatobacter sp. SbA7]
MAESNYKPYEQTGEPFTLGYYVFDLPNGQVFDMLSDAPVVLPEGDLSKLPARYVERVTSGVTLSSRITSRVDEAPAADLLGWGKLSDQELELQGKMRGREKCGDRRD